MIPARALSGSLAPVAVETSRVRAAWLAQVLPLALALLLGAWSMRDVSSTAIVDTDAARHAMNGVFLHDLVANGQIASPVAYGRYYYGRLPALSLPYHPPFFPAVEAVFFWIFGVGVFAARLAVAFSVALSAWLLFHLLAALTRSRLVAGAATVLFCASPIALAVAADVMLEFAALALALAALWHWHRFVNTDRAPTGSGSRAALLFAIFSAAAVWTKQQAVFLGAVPFVFLVLNGRWKALRQWPLWAASALFALSVAGLSALTVSFHGTGVDQVSPPNELIVILKHNLLFYASALRVNAGIAGCAFLASGTLWAIARCRKDAGAALLLAWVVSAFGILLFIGPYDERYLFFMLPAAIALSCAALHEACLRILPPLPAALPMAGLAGLAMVFLLRAPAPHLRGPDLAAARLVDGSVQRIVYCGTSNGAFIFSARTRDARLRSIVVRGDKLPAATFEPEAFEEFVDRYGITAVVLEKTRDPQPWDRLRESAIPSLRPAGEIPIDSTDPRWRGGSLALFRANRAAAPAHEVLKLPIPKIGSDVEVKF